MQASAAVALYVGLNSFIIFGLLWQVVGHRRREKIVLGDGGHAPLIRAIRAHGNAIEVAPIALIGLCALALVGSPSWVIHVGGVSLTLGRALHAIGLSGFEGPSFGRMVGMLLSIFAMVWIGGACVLGALLG
jgi:uncharacterized membrane protein YecN with MAPEG domain